MNTTKYTLTWIVPARPPVHERAMKGTQSFSSILEAVDFFKKLPAGSGYVHFTKEITIREDWTDEFGLLLNNG